MVPLGLKPTEAPWGQPPAQGLSLLTGVGLIAVRVRTPCVVAKGMWGECLVAPSPFSMGLRRSGQGRSAARRGKGVQAEERGCLPEGELQGSTTADKSLASYT